MDNPKQNLMLLDEAPFPQTKIDYANSSTMKTIKKLQRQLEGLRKALQR